MESQLRSNPLTYFGASVDDIDLTRPTMAKEICICGHSSMRHYEYVPGQVMCQVAKMYCPCKTLIPVLEVEDTRAFIFTTDGRGNRHALFRGLKRLSQMSKGSRSLISNDCWLCGVAGQIEPVPLSPQGHLAESAQAKNVMLCEGCILRSMGFDPSSNTSDIAPGRHQMPSEAPGSN
jgi:hypothetical protein